MKWTLLLFLMGGAAQAATVRVTVTGVRNARGHVLVALCGRDTFLQPHCAFQGKVSAASSAVSVAIGGVPPGIYAAEVFHDENDNGVLDKGFFGMPLEGMGFSHDAPMRFGPPRFEAAAFTVGAQDMAVRVTLRYF